MKIYFCKKCRNILGKIDDFKIFSPGGVHFISRSHRSMESKSLKEFYETTCTKCKTHCTFSHQVLYKELSTSEKLKRIKENNEYDMILNPTGVHLKRNGEIIFESNTVIRQKDLWNF